MRETTIRLPQDAPVCGCKRDGIEMSLIHGPDGLGERCFLWRCERCGSEIVGAYMVRAGDTKNWYTLTGPLVVPNA